MCGIVHVGAVSRAIGTCVYGCVIIRFGGSGIGGWFSVLLYTVGFGLQLTGEPFVALGFTVSVFRCLFCLKFVNTTAVFVVFGRSREGDS